MARIYGLFGSMTGKVADVVMSVRNGEQIARKYQPIVANPSTASQVASRAKLKLMSQLSAVLAPVIAMRRQGSVSSRNIFVKTNYPLAGYSRSEATVNLNALSLTGSAVSLPDVVISRGDSGVNVMLEGSAGTLDVDRVVYVLLTKTQDGKLRLRDSAVVSTAGESNHYPYNFAATGLECVVLGYGVRDNTEAARAKFGNMQAITASQVANLVVTRVLTEADLTLTETKGATLAAAV